MPTMPANGIELDYDCFGATGDPCILLIMGLSAQKIAWDEAFCQQLADAGFFVVRFDNRDVGLSSKVRGAPFPDLAADEPGMVDRLFDRRRQRRVEQAEARLAGRSFPERVEELARILDEDGYLAAVERDGEDGTWYIVEHNCAILEVAFRYGQACSSEIGFLREVMPDAEIDRITHMASGEHHCAYRIRPRSA